MLEEILDDLKLRADIASLQEMEYEGFEEGDKDSLFYIRIIGTLRGQQKEIDALTQQRNELLAALETLVKYDTAETEYDGTMIAYCSACGEQDGRHSSTCDFVLVRALIAKARGAA